MFGAKVEIALREKGVEFDLTMVAFSQEDGYSPKWVAARSSIEGYYDEVDARLSGRDYLAGDFGYADIAFFMAQFFAARHTVPIG